jgi:hypothetical protein
MTLRCQFEIMLLDCSCCQYTPRVSVIDIVRTCSQPNAGSWYCMTGLDIDRIFIKVFWFFLFGVGKFRFRGFLYASFNVLRPRSFYQVIFMFVFPCWCRSSEDRIVLWQSLMWLLFIISQVSRSRLSGNVLLCNSRFLANSYGTFLTPRLSKGSSSCSFIRSSA